MTGRTAGRRPLHGRRRSGAVLEGAATQPMQTETGTMQVATPETTAFDLVRFPAAAGYWNNIATVLSELAEKLDPEALAAGAARMARTDVQRLGWLLDFVEQPDRADALAATVAGKRLLPTPLTDPDRQADTAARLGSAGRDDGG